MDNCNIARAAVAAFLGTTLVTPAAQSQPRQREVEVTGCHLDPVAQRVVFYADLNLAYDSAVHELDARIHNAAYDICGPALGYWRGEVGALNCVEVAEEGTDNQVILAIDRAKQKMAGIESGPPVVISMGIGEH